MGAVLSVDHMDADLNGHTNIHLTVDVQLSRSQSWKSTGSQGNYLKQVFGMDAEYKPTPGLTELSDDEDGSAETCDSDESYANHQKGIPSRPPQRVAEPRAVEGNDQQKPNFLNGKRQALTNMSISSRCQLEGMENVKPQTDLFTYFEQCSERLYSKLWTANHARKIGISEAIYHLGEVVYDHGKYQQANDILRRASHIQELVLKESIYFVAWALRDRGIRYRSEDEDYLGLTYHVLATKLVKEPTQDNLQLAWNIHQGIKARRNDSTGPEADRIHRRLKRARNECFPLAQTFSLRNRCKNRGNLSSSMNLSFVG